MTNSATFLQGKRIKLRALEPEDLDYLYQLENDTTLWEVSQQRLPYSRMFLRSYLEQAHRDWHEVQQLRLAIQTRDTDETVGLIDLFDYDPGHMRAAVGIVVYPDTYRGQGFAREALQLLIDYAFQKLQLHQLYAHILTEHTKSRQLFEACGFKQTGLMPDWWLGADGYRECAFYQLLSTQPTS